MESIGSFSERASRRQLEHAVYQVLLNHTAPLRAAVQRVRKKNPLKRGAEKLFVLRSLIEELVFEVKELECLLTLEHDHVVPEISRIKASEVVYAAVNLAAPWVHGKVNITVEPDCTDPEIVTCPVLLKTVVVTMLKSACESAALGADVGLGWRATAAEVEFWVREPEVMASEAARRILERGFFRNLKNRGKGIGNMRVLTRYLGGRINISTYSASGTLFAARFPLVI